MALCLSILLYGSEVWSLREDLLSRLRNFHHRCVQTICRINIAHTIRHHISTSSLLARLGRTFRNLLPPQTSSLGRSRLPHATQPFAAYATYGVGCQPPPPWLPPSVGRLKRPSAAGAYRPTSQLGANSPPTDARGDKSAGGQLGRPQPPPRTGRLSGRSSGMAPRKSNKILN